MNDNDKKLLIDTAVKASEKARSPYSGFRVGAAVIDEQDKIYTGCNIENASYGLTCCAERVAIFKAVSEGSKRIKGLAVFSPDNKGYISPCGACRQVIHEIAPESIVILADNKKNYIEKTPDELLPGAFSLDS
ncbi:MAG: cytidine deaminase [Spirochaetes bacterium]|nr:cytidine deaminase [Spirochaetota bacterium]MCK5267833.1 cytidine deaminase [Spirochaetota bacterium]